LSAPVYRKLRGDRRGGEHEDDNALQTTGSATAFKIFLDATS
jgi:hypothetical protein